VLSQRVYSWLSHAPLILHDADESFYRRFLRSLARQVRYLRHTIVDTPEGIPRLHALVALTYAALSMSGQHRHLRNTIKQLVAEVEAQILPDGGHISRNPGALIEALADLLPLRQAFAACNVTPPEAINHAIDRMMPMLRFFRHGDGNFAHFNGMGRTPNDLVASILAYDDARGAPLSGAPHAGYQRLQINDTVVLMDTGAPPPLRVSREAHAGCLSFEMSSGSQRIVVNCGLPPVGRDNWRQIARATAAHSTVTLNDTSSCHILEGSVFRNVIGSPIVGGPKSVPVERDETDGAVAVLASHDGYANRYGVIHHRALRLSEDGHRLDGEDAFIPAKGDLLPQNRPDAFALRFHLHPSVKASRLTDGRGVMLVLPNREAWTFNAYEDRVELEESIYLSAPEGSRRTQQIVIVGRARKIPRIHWSFVHISPATNGKAVERSEEPELPL